MYQDIKSCVKYNGEQSDFFQSFRGVRQGENLSPVLFSLFLNDLEAYLTSKNCTGLQVNNQMFDENLIVHMIILLYADDTVIFADSEANLQRRCI